jgi:hypothetical protein
MHGYIFLLEIVISEHIRAQMYYIQLHPFGRSVVEVAYKQSSYRHSGAHSSYFKTLEMYPTLQATQNYV